jgi:hypothetical protein
MIFLIHRKHSFGPPRSVTGIALACYGDIFTFLYADDIVPPRSVTGIALACCGDSFTFLYVDDIVPPRSVTGIALACYGDSFTFLYVDDIRTSQESHLLASTVCYEMTLLTCT